MIDNSDGVGPDDDLYGDYNEDDGDGGGDEQDQVFPSQLDGEDFDEETKMQNKSPSSSGNVTKKKIQQGDKCFIG